MNTWMLVAVISVTPGMSYSDIEIIHTPAATEADCHKLKKEIWTNKKLVTTWRNKITMGCVEIGSYQESK